MKTGRGNTTPFSAFKPPNPAIVPRLDPIRKSPADAFAGPEVQELALVRELAEAPHHRRLRVRFRMASEPIDDLLEWAHGVLRRVARRVRKESGACTKLGAGVLTLVGDLRPRWLGRWAEQFLELAGPVKLGGKTAGRVNELDSEGD